MTVTQKVREVYNDDMYLLTQIVTKDSDIDCDITMIATMCKLNGGSV
jgi:hypothetical protein